MKTFEEKWTAWLDDQLSGKELEEFEASLPDLAAARAEKQDARKLGAFLKEQLAASPLTNEDFFSHQIHEQITRGSETNANAHEGDRAGGPFHAWFGVERPRWVFSFLRRLSFWMAISPENSRSISRKS